MKATVYKSTGSFYQITDASGRQWQARIRGKFKIDDEIKSTNPLAVGDQVEMIVEDEANNRALITAIDPRHNYMVRVSPHNRHQKHIIAANLDAAIVVATIKSPRTSFGFLDRFLITAEAYHIPAVIVFNKADLLKGKAKEDWQVMRYIYEAAGYPTFTVEAISREGMEALLNFLKDKTTLFSGHSGVGKSTLINALDPELDLRVQAVSEWSGKGQHTTTFAEMFDLSNGAKIIDTPGVKEFGIVDMKREELAQYFPEMRQLLPDCKFNNCVHINEPNCAVKSALGTTVSIERYESYLAILSTLSDKNY